MKSDKYDKSTNDAIEMYLLKVTENLTGVPNTQVSDIVTELRSHVLDCLGPESAVATDADVQEVLGKLGPPEVLAEMYLTENLMTRADKSRSPWVVMRTLFRLAIRSVWALVVFLVSLIGYMVAMAFFVCAVGKPFYPYRDGLWWNIKSHTLVGLGFIWPEQYDRELLGWWIVPLGLLSFGLTVLVTTQFARWNIRCMKRSGGVPFAPRGPVNASRSAAAEMKRRNVSRVICFCLALLFAAPRVLAAQVRSASVTPSHYSITIVPDFENNTFAGDEFIDIHLSEPTASIELNAAEVTFDDATITNGIVTQEATVTTDKDKELATFKVSSPYEPSQVVLHIRYRGVIRDSCCGFYRANAGKYRYGVMLSSARSVFPSFDDPTAKATFDIAATVGAADGAISNGRLLSDTPDANRTHHTLKFATTPRMSTYLVTIAIGQFECETGGSDGIPIRVCGPPSDKGLGRFALEAAEFTLHFYNQYFDLKYPYGKLDYVGLPGIPGAEENTACILALDSALFGKADTASLEWLKNVALGPVAHEMAHQWLGDLVTMKSQEEIWLNEGMATWMQYKPVTAWKPAWHVELEQTARTNAAMDVDSLPSTRPIRSLDAPDKVTYDKSAAVLRMIEQYVGAETFRKGINSYVKDHAYGNARSEDLWNEIAKSSGQPMDRVMAGFITQPGIPAVSVQSRCANNETELTLSQRRFVAAQPRTAAADEQELWQIPVCFQFKSKAKCQLLSAPVQHMVFDGCGYVYANRGGVGYYRSLYDSDDLRSLASNAESTLTAPERMNLANDAWAAVRSGLRDIGDFLTLAKLMSAEPEPVVLKSIAADLAYVNEYLVSDSDRQRYSEWISATFGPRIQETNLQALAEKGDVDVQAELLRIVGGIGRDPKVLESAREAAHKVVEGKGPKTPALTAVLQLGYHVGDSSLYEALLGHMRSSKNPQERDEYLESIAQFDDPQLIQHTLALDVSDELSVGDARALRSLLFQNPAARSATWNFVRHNWDVIQKKDLVTTGLFGDLSQFCDSATRGQIQEFFQAHTLPDELKQPLMQAMSTIDECNTQRERIEPHLHIWLNLTSALSGT
jgi:aminopeptidase N